MLLSGHARSGGSGSARPAECSTDQRQGTMRANRTQGSERPGQDYPILSRSGRKRLTVIRVADCPDRGCRADLCGAFAVANGGELREFKTRRIPQRLIQSVPRTAIPHREERLTLGSSLLSHEEVLEDERDI